MEEAKFELHLRCEIDEVHGPVELMVELLGVVQLEPILHALCRASQYTARSKDKKRGEHERECRMPWKL
jgi:hypothetical protein